MNIQELKLNILLFVVVVSLNLVCLLKGTEQLTKTKLLGIKLINLLS